MLTGGLQVRPDVHVVHVCAPGSSQPLGTHLPDNTAPGGGIEQKGLVQALRIVDRQQGAAHLQIPAGGTRGGTTRGTTWALALGVRAKFEPQLGNNSKT